MKQVLRADKSLSCGKHEQTFRAVIAVLGGSERNKQETNIKKFGSHTGSKDATSSGEKKTRWW